MASLWKTVLVGLALGGATTIQYDPDISNGTCYYKKGKEADAAYAPAGNAAIGHVFCCQLGDKLNQNNSCVTEDKSMPVYTYIAGCTDPTYEHESCPYKGNYTNYQWVGLVFCEYYDYWVGCENDESATPRVSKESSDCTCNLNTESNDEPLFQASEYLVALGYLPNSKGETIKWEGGWGPAYESAASSSITPSTKSSSISVKTLPPPTINVSTTVAPPQTVPGEITSGTSTTAVSTAEPSVSRTSAASGIGSLSGGQKAGIGVSIAAVGIISLSFGLCAVHRFRKCVEKAKEKSNRVGGDSERSPEGKPIIPDVGAADLRSPAWSGHISELPGSPPTVSPTDQNLDCASTIVNSPSWSSMVSTSPKQSSEQPVYRPFRYQPSIALEGIQEMPDHERPRWAQTDYGTYGPNRGYNIEHGRMSQTHGNGELADGNNNVHELPG